MCVWACIFVWIINKYYIGMCCTSKNQDMSISIILNIILNMSPSTQFLGSSRSERPSADISWCFTMMSVLWRFMVFYHDVRAWMYRGVLLWHPCLDVAWCFTMAFVHGCFMTFYHDVGAWMLCGLLLWCPTVRVITVRGRFVVFYYDVCAWTFHYDLLWRSCFMAFY